MRVAKACALYDRPTKTCTASKSSRIMHNLTLLQRSACLGFVCRPSNHLVGTQLTKNMQQCLRWVVACEGDSHFLDLTSPTPHIHRWSLLWQSHVHFHSQCPFLKQ